MLWCMLYKNEKETIIFKFLKVGINSINEATTAKKKKKKKKKDLAIANI